jgi:hypothetical protein
MVVGNRLRNPKFQEKFSFIDIVAVRGVEHAGASSAALASFLYI